MGNAAPELGFTELCGLRNAHKAAEGKAPGSEALRLGVFLVARMVESRPEKQES